MKERENCQITSSILYICDTSISRLYSLQVALAGTQIWWTTEVNIAFSRMEEGFEAALKDYYKKQVNQLNTLINLLLGDLSKGDRQRIMTICTIDVHARDVVQKMIAQKVENSQAFIWLSQLRHRYVCVITPAGIWYLPIPSLDVRSLYDK